MKSLKDLKTYAKRPRFAACLAVVVDFHWRSDHDLLEGCFAELTSEVEPLPNRFSVFCDVFKAYRRRWHRTNGTGAVLMEHIVKFIAINGVGSGDPKAKVIIGRLIEAGLEVTPHIHGVAASHKLWGVAARLADALEK